MMNTETAREVIATLRVEYYGVLEAVKDHDERHGTNYAAYTVDFYGFLLQRDFSRQQLSAYGISRANALTWRGS
jgi:hypothetical protein